MTDMIRLERLDQSSLALADGEEDVRDWPVVDARGEEIGTVSGLFVDPHERKVRFLEVRGDGVLGIGENEYLIPIEAIESIGDGRVRLGHARDHVARAPRYDPALTNDEDHWSDIYGWYGYMPYWGVWGPAPVPRRYRGRTMS